MNWKSGHNDSSSWIQYLNEEKNFAVLSFIRNKDVRWVQILLQELPEELTIGSEVICEYSFQDYNGDEYTFVNSTGFIKDNINGQRVFTSGQSYFDDDLEPYRKVIERIKDKFLLAIAGHERIFTITPDALEDLKKIYED